MKRLAPTIFIAAVLLLSGIVWQQQRKEAPAGAGASQPAIEDGVAVVGPTPAPVKTEGTPSGSLQRTPTPTVKMDSAAPPLESLSQALPLDPSVPQESADFPSSKPVTPMPLEPLVSQAGQQSLIAKDGTPLRFELGPGQPATAVEFQAWTDDQVRNAAGHYDWRFKIKVVKGVLVERLDPTVFVAPETGYGSDFEYAIPQDSPAGEWRNSLSKSFFIHFDNDTYGLLNVQMVAGGAHFVTIKAYLNPAAGSKNLQPPPPLPVMRR